ncbi:MAG: ABC-2 transporter permease [Thermoanaerobaculia bacterium]
MNTAMVQRLVYKDWYFNRWPIVLYVALGLLSLGLVSQGGELAFFAGSVALITVLISIGIHLTMVTVIHERRDHTLAFVMSLPISAREYTLAKLLANLLIFGLAWGTLAVGAVAVIAGRASLPDGLIPFTLTVLGELFAGYCLVLSVAVVSESLGFTIAAIVVGNLLVQALMYWESHLPTVAADLQGDALHWRPQLLAVLGAEAAAVVLLLGLTFYFQSRKTDYL